mmetsp:Transcript_17984/g.30630  ORF Transcript_17984/g.30630 Transcript_17984/m.30630 type:complete len:88 (-) Transcript_17984:225-488(-)
MRQTMDHHHHHHSAQPNDEGDRNRSTHKWERMREDRDVTVSKQTTRSSEPKITYIRRAFVFHESINRFEEKPTENPIHAKAETSLLL